MKNSANQTAVAGSAELAVGRRVRRQGERHAAALQEGTGVIVEYRTNASGKLEYLVRRDRPFIDYGDLESWLPAEFLAAV